MISSKISIHRYIAQRCFMWSKNGHTHRAILKMTVKLQELAIRANLGLLWYLQTVAIVKAKLWLL